MTGWMKQTRRLTMANETKVYVGKNGAKTLYKRLKDLIGRITTYQKVTNTTESGVPIVVNPNSRTIYLVKDNTVVGDDKYKEWIWTSDLGWECIGTTSIPENAWKQWAEDNGSVGTTDTVYLGKNNNLARTWSFGFGNNNTSSSTLDNVDWSGSDVVMIGSFNSAIDAAGAYQVGFRNSVVNNHRMSEASPDYNYYTAINFGNGNEIDAEGMNLGKDNTAADFGMNIGQHNTANHASLSIGERVSTNQASISIGTDSIAENKSLSIGFGSVAAGVLYNNGEFLHSGEYGSSIAIGINHLCAAKNSIAIGSGVTTADTYSIVSGGSFAILAEGIQLAQQASSIYGNSFGVGSCLTLTSSSFSIGRFNTADNYSYAIGERNTVNCGSFAIGQNNTLIGDPNGTHYAYGYAFATGRDLNDVRGRSCTFGIGNNHITQFAYAAGLGNNSIHESAVAVGIENTDVYYHSTAVGAHNNNIHGDGVAIGNGNRDIRDMGTAVGSYNYEVYGGSFAAGEANAAQNGSIAIGISNKARCGGILFGIGNYAIAYPTDSYYISYHANSVVMGFGNEVYNVREGLHKSGWTKSITTCGIAIGAYIKAYGHNFISFGSSNTLGDGANWMNDTAANTDNDGFMTAIGFQCTAKRNYDFAYGYQSVANGGENIAFQHSTAIGYRNIAIVDSNVQNSIASVALCESDLLATASDIKDNGMVHNLLFHSKVACVRNFNSSTLFHTRLNVTNSGNGFSRNIFNIGTMNHVVNLDLQSYGSVADNILIGAKKGEYLGTWNDYGSINLSTNTAIGRNVLLNNAYQSLNTTYACVDNMIRSSEINIVSGAVSTFADNFIDCSGLEMTYGSSRTNIIGNVLHGRSKLYAPNTSVAGFHYNFLLNSILGNNTGTPTRVKSGQENTRNFLFNAAAYNSDSCFCMSLGGGVSSRGDGIQLGAFNRSDYNGFDKYTPGSVLADCISVFNFGDGICISSANSVNFGHNKMSDSSDNFIAGLNNIAIGRTESPYSLTNVRIFGNDNKVNNLSSGSDVAHLTVIGDTNTINTDVNCGENTIIGSLNYFVEPYTIQTITPAQIETPLSQRNYYKVSESCIMPDGSSTYLNRITYVNTTDYYVRYGNRVAYMTSSDPSYAATTPVQTSPSNFQSMFSAGTLPVGVYYQMTSSGNINEIPSGILLRPGVVYDLGPYNSAYNTRYSIANDIQIALNRGIVGYSPVSHNSRNTIIGSVNGIGSRVVDYTILGSNNTVKCTSGFTSSDNYAISNGLVQGNDNDVRNGSNIVTMGNGNVSTGHNSVAIGCQLISNQWQTVIGKYNVAIAGPNRLSTQTPQDPTKALLIVGNGYSTKDDYEWQDETYITRSNALELYADGRLKISGKIEASNIPPAPVADGQYALVCEVVSGVATYRWVAVGSN